jgi:hypothetical protein
MLAKSEHSAHIYFLGVVDVREIGYVELYLDISLLNASKIGLLVALAAAVAQCSSNRTRYRTLALRSQQMFLKSDRWPALPIERHLNAGEIGQLACCSDK